MRVKLEEMGKEVERGAGRANELWGGVAGVKQRALQAENEGWAVVDEEGLNQVLEVRWRLSLSLSFLRSLVRQSSKGAA